MTLIIQHSSKSSRSSSSSATPSASHPITGLIPSRATPSKYPTSNKNGKNSERLQALEKIIGKHS